MSARDAPDVGVVFIPYDVGSRPADQELPAAPAGRQVRIRADRRAVIRGVEYPVDDPAAPVSIEDRIDAAVGQLCACGCRRGLDPAGPSAYFFDAGCQHRWHEQHADDADDVYLRPDAAVTYIGHDDLTVPLRAPRPEQSADRVEYARRRLTEMQREEQRRREQSRTELPDCPDPHGVAYRRLCAQCATWSVPQVWQEEEEPVEIYTWASVLPVRHAGRTVLRHACRCCGQELAGQAYLADVEPRDDRRLVLSLADGQARAQRVVSVLALGRTDDREAFIRGEWEALEQQLDRFRRSWSGRREHLEAMRCGAGSVDPAADVRVAGTS